MPICAGSNLTRGSPLLDELGFCRYESRFRTIPSTGRARHTLFVTVSQRVQQQLPPLVASQPASRLLGEFIVEGLLNDAQHAGGENALGREAWISARRWSRADIEILAPDELLRGSERWRQRTLAAGAV